MDLCLASRQCRTGELAMKSVVQIPVGIDISKLWFDVFVLEEGSSHEKRFSNDMKGFEALTEFLGDKPGHICLEATGGYEQALVGFLLSTGVAVSTANSLLVRRFAQGLGLLHKTDRIDAKVLALYCQVKQPSLRLAEDEARTLLRHLVGVWKDLQAQSLQLRARLRGPTLPEFARPALAAVLESLDVAMKQVMEQITRTVSESEELTQDMTLLCTIPGVASVSAMQILSHLPVGDLRSARSLACYAGVIPAHQESGTSVKRRSKIGSVCNRLLRKTLFMAAIVARQRCLPLAEFANKLVKRGKTKKQAIVAVMRKLAHAIFAILSYKTPFDPNKMKPQT